MHIIFINDDVIISSYLYLHIFISPYNIHIYVVYVIIIYYRVTLVRLIPKVFDPYRRVVRDVGFYVNQKRPSGSHTGYIRYQNLPSKPPTGEGFDPENGHYGKDMGIRSFSLS